MNRYYAILGLPSTASKDEVRRAYRKLVLLWHPDKNPSPEAHAKFIAITEAYDILMGERAAPRTGTTYRRSTTAAPKPQPKSQAQVRYGDTRQREQLMREKFERIRQQHLRAPDSHRRREEYYMKATMYFILAGGTIVFGVLLHVTVLHIANLVWTIPLCVGLGMRWLWTGGRIKMRTDMIYGGRTDYSSEDIAEFFRTRYGFVQNSSQVDGK